MTNKEAVKILTELIKCTDLLSDIDHESMFIAIKALEDRPHGKWIPNRHSKYINYGRHCSLCGRNVEFSENFCPKCGADMREDNNEH